jgi:hypothetical protein
MSYDGPGIYRHYKGGHYRVLGVAQHESTGAKTVIYHSYSVEHDLGRWMDGVEFVARPLNIGDGPDAFNEPHDGGMAPVERFVKEDGDT